MHDLILDNGARLKLYASPYTAPGQGVNEWAFGYPSVEDRFNGEGEAVSYARPTGTENSILTNDKDNKVDIAMTHGPAKYILDRSSNLESLGCPHLFRAMRKTRPMLHCFGHVHKGYGAQQVRWEEDRNLPDDDDDDDGIRQKIHLEGLLEGGVRRVEIRSREEGAETTFVNAALMGRDGMLDNVPWLIEIDLELA